MKRSVSVAVVVQVLSLFFITCSFAIASDQLDGLTKANPIMVDQAKETQLQLAGLRQLSGSQTAGFAFYQTLEYDLGRGEQHGR
ncbi:MAG: hypothetical protein JSV14_16595 [Deltaproteobacteria bacterium]|nr:MAG: hypothetical protein JSV14_16595 [Deltaproteobacteria bacterium]